MAGCANEERYAVYKIDIQGSDFISLLAISSVCPSGRRPKSIILRFKPSKPGPNMSLAAATSWLVLGQFGRRFC